MTKRGLSLGAGIVTFMAASLAGISARQVTNGPVRLAPVEAFADKNISSRRTLTGPWSGEAGG